MSSTAPAELNADAIIERIATNEYPREVVLTVARGFLPLPQDDLIAVLAYLGTSADPEVGELAKSSLDEIPGKAVMDFAANETISGEHLGFLMRASSDSGVLEALIRNRSVSDTVVADLAGRVDGPLQDVIVINQTRILRSPSILEALLANPRLSPDARRRSLEIREEFFEKKARIQQDQEAAAAVLALFPSDDTDEGPRILDLPIEEIADLLARADEEPEPIALAPVELTEVEAKDPNKRLLWSEILKMTVSQKVHLAFKGDKMIRMLLVRERNRLVASAVMRNPRMTENEGELIAGMRNVEEEVLRLVGNRREWMTKYPIALALVRNPKAPIGVVLPQINRLVLRDLKSLKDDKGVSETVRSAAKRLYLARTQKK